jgi:hypothetical protein
MTSKNQTTWPVPLSQRDNSLGAAVREYAQSTEEPCAEPAAYARVLGRMGGRSRVVPMMAAGFVMGVLATAGVALILGHRGASVSTFPGTVASRSVAPAPAPPRLHPSVSAEASSPAAQASRTSQIPSPPTASIRLAALPVALPTGRVDLVDQATAVLSTDAVASGRVQTGNTEIALSKGSIELHVLPRAPGHDFAVRAGRYRFAVVGTTFTISQTRSRIELEVSEGTVAVWRETKRLATVGAGGQWAVELVPTAPQRAQPAHAQAEPASAVVLSGPHSSEVPALAPPPVSVPATEAAGTFAARAALPARTTLPAAAPPVPVPGPSPVPATALTAPAAASRDCGQLAASQHVQEALSCYQNQAAQGGLAGETAQYEVARLWRDTFGNPARALAAFKEQRFRFPHGVLRIEADLSIIELLPRLDRHADALAESAQFLNTHPTAARRGELRLLRGNIFREVLRDLDHAEREYALGAESGGRAGDDSRFLRAVCLEALGRVHEAREAYDTYLSQPGALHAQEVKKRLERLGR